MLPTMGARMGTRGFGAVVRAMVLALAAGACGDDGGTASDGETTACEASGTAGCECATGDCNPGETAATSTMGTSNGPGGGSADGGDASSTLGTGAGGEGSTADPNGSGTTGPTDLPPVVQIINPGDGTQRPAGVVIPFVGEAEDPEDGTLVGPALVWTDDLEGELGTGTNVDAMLTVLGPHTITLTATDGDGNAADDSIELVIFMQ